ncbi:MAG: hypothetical protein HeimC2_06690 [Candidatus Heimdallarchaeota archaeon LC_2]|nr:MAG: hypothetical protein HeimC2_06690 [Candidatus Heimdallarchaeota archaeon LC_2]
MDVSPPKYQKIAIWGSVGMGKTTLAKLLSSKLQINNIIFTDDIIFTDELSKIQTSKLLADITDGLNKFNWIIDGNLGELIPRLKIMKEADLIIIFNIPFYLSLKRMLIRDIKLILDPNKHKEFSNLKNSKNFICNSVKILFESIAIIKNYKRLVFFNLLTMARKNKLDQKVVIIRSDGGLDKFLENM